MGGSVIPVCPKRVWTRRPCRKISNKTLTNV